MLADSNVLECKMPLGVDLMQPNKLSVNSKEVMCPRVPADDRLSDNSKMSMDRSVGGQHNADV